MDDSDRRPRVTTTGSAAPTHQGTPNLTLAKAKQHGYASPQPAIGSSHGTLDWQTISSRTTCRNIQHILNVFFIGVSLYGARLSTQEGLPTRFLIGFAGCALIGLGSFLFHATLLYEAQLADELP
ncbi:hypothetical protein EI94DRAFT_1816692 [Lactarius quietus]|nr:hypothetical protein EI94DRAFT_1816692 [Lactarius quietus]